MGWRIFLFIFGFLSFEKLIFGEKDVTPKQIHLAYGTDPTRMTVTWSTKNATESAITFYGIGQLTHIATGSVTRFVDPGMEHHVQYIHRVTMTSLKPGNKYVYKVGSKPENVWSGVYNFTAMQDGSKWSPRICLFGDFGLVNAQSLPRLMQDKDKQMYDAVFHVGDFAYDLDSDDGDRGDKFLNMMQPMTAEMPYMTCPGNHESAYNFTHYKNRFTMPGDEGNKEMFYSFNIGPAHVISLATEYYYYLQYGILQPFRQYEWLKKDLEEANKPENRAERPWIIVMGHRPMYCSNNDSDDCTRKFALTRSGIPIIHAYGLEKLLYEHGVDLEVWAHEHNYERFWPVYDRKVYNGSYDHPYTNPKAPVHIITGSAGCQERHDGFITHISPWSAIRSNDYGYTRMHIFNSTHLYWEQVSDDKESMGPGWDRWFEFIQTLWKPSVIKGGAIIDKIWLIKDKHGYGAYGNA